LLAHLAGTPGGEALAQDSRGRDVLFLIADSTRDEPHGDILDAGFSCLTDARSITVSITTGSHRADTPGNRRIVRDAHERAAARGLPEPRVVIHDCATATFTDHGTTSRGNRVLLSDILDGAQVFLVATDMKHHYFAGYSNALKDFLPGVASFETIERNHRLALEPDATFGQHPLHRDASRHSNPVAEDMLEAYRMSVGKRPSHALATVTVDRRIAWARIGLLEEVSAECMDEVDRVASFSVEPTRHLVVSAGGAPQDDSLYLSQRGIELTRAAVADDAEILLLAECADGIADGENAYRNFYVELTRPLDQVLDNIRDGYRLYQHKAYKFAELMTRVRAIHLHSALPAEEVRAAHLHPAPDPQALVDRWIRDDPSCTIAFFDEANRMCVLGSDPK
jgi:nickel-dependent lactate racemase